MKQYLDFKENDVVSTDDGNYIDFFPEDVIEHIYYESEDEATMNYQVNYKRLEENKFRKNIIDDENKESDKIKKKKKIFLDDFNYTEKNNKEKKNKEKIKKESKFKEKLKNLNIFGRFLKSIEFLSRILFLLLVFFIIFTVFRYNKLNKNDEIKENSNIVVEEVKEEQHPNKVVINNENLTFKELMIARAKDLNNIIEGEKECINRLSNDKISIKEAASYFDGTQQKKEELLYSFYNEGIKTEYYDVQNELKEIYIYSINLSKQIKIRYNNSDNKKTMVSDFNSFLIKHEERISNYELVLGNFNN